MRERAGAWPVHVHARQDPPTRLYGLRMDRNLAFLDPDDFLISLPDCCCITEMWVLSLLSHLFKKKKASDIIASFDSNITILDTENGG